MADTIPPVAKRSRKGTANPFSGWKHTPEWRTAASERQNTWTAGDISKVREWYLVRANAKLDLQELATALGRSKPDVSDAARKMGLTNRNRKTGRKPTRKHATPEDSLAAIGRSAAERIKKNGHPRGMLGKHQTAESKARISAAQLALSARGEHPGQRPRSPERREKMARATSKRMRERPSSVYSSARRGYREDMPGIFFRSRWEANYARFLTLLQSQGKIAKWEFEPDTFWFEQIRRGVRSYTPDFKVTTPSGALYYDEVKGWMDPKSVTKLKRMAKYHPSVVVNLIGEKAYTEIEKKLGGAIPNWEFP